jgi:hypothetical protein
MPLVGFGQTISVFELAKPFHAIDSAAVLIGKLALKDHNIRQSLFFR